MSERPRRGPTRRRMLLAVGAGTVALAGCLGGTEDGAETVPTLGDPDADVTLEVYEDLGCPACASYAENGFPAIENNYIEPASIRYEHRDLISTANGAEAANAAREVFDRHGNEEFWAFKTALLPEHGRLESDPLGTIEETAGELDLDADAVVDAASDGTHQDDIDADVERAQSLGAGVTPSFVVDGSLVGEGAGSGTLQSVAAELDDALQ